MSNIIESFIKKLINWQDILEVKKYDACHSGEFCNLANMHYNNDVTGLLKFWEKKLLCEYFELPHPDYPELNTRAVFNLLQGPNNLVFMIDSNNNHPWVFVQCTNMIDFVATDKAIYKLGVFEKKIISMLENLSFVDKNKLTYRDIPFGFALGINRPYHFFYDHFKYYLEIDRFGVSKPIKENNSYFRPHGVSSGSLPDDSNVVWLFPAVIRMGVLDDTSSGLIKDINQRMESFILNDVMEGSGEVKKNDDHIKLWYGITGQKRSWIEQVDGIDNIVKNLVKFYSKVEVFIDGMTAPEGKEINCRDDDDVYDDICKRISGMCKLTSLIGCDYREKVKICSGCDYFIANAGTGCMVPLRFCKKPGVLHSNTKLITFPGEYPGSVKFVDKNFIEEVVQEGRSQAQFVSYSIPWQHVFNLLAESINEEEGRGIFYLDVPDRLPDFPIADDVLHAIETDDFINKLISFGFQKHKLPDVLRETAFFLENSREYEAALKLMEAAKYLRPNGPVIKRKVDEYKRIVGFMGVGK